MSAWDQNKIVDRYCDALLSLSTDSNTLSVWLDHVTAINALFAQDASFAKFIAHPRMAIEKKLSFVTSLAASFKLDKHLSHGLALLVRNRRGALLPLFLDRFTKRLKKEMGIVSAMVTSADSLSPAQQKSLTQAIAPNGELVEFNTTIDPSLLGGLIVQIGSWRMDDSVKGKLERLTRRLQSAA